MDLRNLANKIVERGQRVKSQSQTFLKQEAANPTLFAQGDARRASRARGENRALAEMCPCLAGVASCGCGW